MWGSRRKMKKKLVFFILMVDAITFLFLYPKP
jgi:hypothetical protein